MAIVDAVEPGNAFAEKLGLWIHFADAITLSAVHNDDIASRPGMHAKIHHEAQTIARAAVGIEFERTQTTLINSIMKSCSPNSGKTAIKLPIPMLALPMDLAAAYAPYRRFYEAHQRDMALSIQPLRVHIRQALGKASARRKKLADLDATLENVLRARENQLLSKVPVLLKKRFEQLFKAHQQTLLNTRQADDPAAWTQAGAWLARFCNDMQTLLLAELELRLQPSVGLMEAFNNEKCNE
jgi:hypothetical protein